MKMRFGFVSNSSSCSFVILKKDLTEEQLDLIVKHIDVAEYVFGDKYWESVDEWQIRVGTKYVRLDTSMNNFDMLEFLDKIHIPREKIVIHTNSGDAISPEAKRQEAYNKKMWQAEMKKMWTRIPL